MSWHASSGETNVQAQHSVQQAVKSSEKHCNNFDDDDDDDDTKISASSTTKETVTYGRSASSTASGHRIIMLNSITHVAPFCSLLLLNIPLFAITEILYFIFLF